MFPGITTIIESLAANVGHTLEVLLRPGPRPVILVSLLALVGWLAGAAVGVAARRRRPGLIRRLLSCLRLPVVATVGLSGVLWSVHRDVAAFVLVPLALFWALAAIRAAGHLIGWLVTRAAAPWKLQEDAASEEPAPARERRRFVERVGQEISRVKHWSSPSLTVVTIGVKVGQPTLIPGLQQLIWQRALQSARQHYLLQRTEDGDVLALLPDTDRPEVERWCASFGELDADVAMGCAAYPDDGATAQALLERAVTRMWLDQGAAPGELVSVSSPRHRGPFSQPVEMPAESPCIPLGDDDIILDDAIEEPHLEMSPRGCRLQLQVVSRPG